MKIFSSSPTGAESVRGNSPAVMSEEEAKQEETTEVSQSQSQDKDEDSNSDEELDLENDFFGLNEINEKDNVKVNGFYSGSDLINSKF